MKYGFSNTVRDAIDLLKFARDSVKSLTNKYADRQISKSSQGRSINPDTMPFNFMDGHEVTTLTVACHTLDDAFARVVRGLMDIDVFPELGNIWDVVPYSFVIDWFIPFGDLFDAIDANTYRSTLQCYYTTVSYNYEFTGVALEDWFPVLQGQVIVGNVDVRYYNRKVLSEIPTPSFSLHVPAGFTQWIPAGSLLFQSIGPRI
jgi:hypothetical protein